MIVFTNGCFDVIHKGHVALLAYCRVLAGPSGRVVVGVNDDQSVSRLKGLERPIHALVDRIFVLRELRSVDEVIPFSEDTPLDLIRSLKPDIVVKGGDYRPEDVVGYGLCRVEIFGYVDGYSTTGIIESLGHR